MSTSDPPVSLNVGVRLPADLVDRLDAFISDAERSVPGLHLTRSSAARLLMVRSLDAHEATKPTKETP